MMLRLTGTIISIVFTFLATPHAISSTSNIERYGTLLIARDVYYDEEIRDELTELRKKIKSSEDVHQEEDGLTSSSTTSEVLQRGGVLSEDGVTLTLIGYKGGTLESQVNQDRAFVLSPYHIFGSRYEEEHSSTGIETKIQLMGVMDGHGHLGEVVSEYARDRLPSMLSKKIMNLNKDNLTMEKDVRDRHIHEAIKDTFLDLNATVPTKDQGGCTMSILLRIENKVHIANVGDSRTFLVTYDPNTEITSIVYETREDKPHLPDERARIEKVGGKVLIPSEEDMKLGDSSRVVCANSSSALAMSRSIGDWICSSTGVISEPIIETIDLTELHGRNDKDSYIVSNDGSVKIEGDQEILPMKIFSVSASDGLLDYISPDHLVTSLAQALYTSSEGKTSVHPATLCESLIMEAAEGWQKDMGHQYRDDIIISVMKIL